MAEPRVGGPGLSKSDSRERGPGWDEFTTRWASLHGGVDARRSSVLFTSWLGLSYATGRGLARLGMTPTSVTAIGLLLSAAVPVVVLGRGFWLFLAAGLVLLSALADSADGAIAILTGRTSRIGSFYDSVADRLSEAAWLLALWLLGTPGILVAVCGGLVWLHEYVRARAALSGMPGVGAVTAAERPTRVLLVIAALLLGGVVWLVNPRLTAGVATVVVGGWTCLGLLGGARLLGAARATLR